MIRSCCQALLRGVQGAVSGVRLGIHSRLQREAGADNIHGQHVEVSVSDRDAL